jgi:hypothetical protein
VCWRKVSEGRREGLYGEALAGRRQAEAVTVVSNDAAGA